MEQQTSLIALTATVMAVAGCGFITGLSNFEVSGGAAGSGGAGDAGGSVTGGGHAGAPAVGGAGGVGGQGVGGQGVGGQGEAPPGCDVDSDGVLSVACPGGTDCDDDGDAFDSMAAVCAGGTDCDDTDPVVHPNQAGYFENAQVNVGFDYNCSGAEEPEYGFYQCMGTCIDTTDVFFEDVPCGELGTFGDCLGPCDGYTDGVTTRRCH